MIKKEELIPGKFYTVKHYMYEWIWCFHDIQKDSIRTNGSIATNTHNFFGNEASSWGSYSDCKELREATPDEENWLKECIKANKWVEKPKPTIPTINNSYSIY